VTPDKHKKEIDHMVDELIDSLMREDPIGIVVRGHVYIESMLIRLIEAKLPDPKAIDFARLTFPNILGLSVALKLIPRGDKLAYEKLNAFRNKLAHSLSTKMTDSDEKDFYQGLSEAQKQLIKDIPDVVRNKPLGLLRASIAALWSQTAHVLSEITHRKPETASERVNPTTGARVIKAKR
jgi:hypothetical protein